MTRWLNLADFIRGLTYPLRGFSILRRHRGLSRYWLPPIALTFIALVTSVVLSVRYHDDVVNLVWGTPSGSDWLSNLLAAFHFLVQSVALLTAFALSFVLAMLLASVFAAPFNDALSAAVEERETGIPAPPFSLAGVLSDLGRTVRLELLKLFLYLGVLGPLLIASWLVPGAFTVLYSVFATLFTVVYFALDYVDWPAARRRYGARQRIALLSVRPLTTLGFGAAVSICLFIPIVNLFLMPLAVAGGTRLFLDLSEYAAQQA
jgi:CysZ protein